MLAARGYRTKKQLRESVGQEFRYTETSAFGQEFPESGNVAGIAVVGPSPYERKWYAQVWTEAGILRRVK